MNARVALLFTLVIATAVATYGHDDDDDDAGAGPCSAFRNVRSINGSCNNLGRRRTQWGASGGNFSEIEGYKIWPASSPNEREISNRLFANTATKEDIFFNAAERRSGTEPDPHNRNQFFVAFGQFIAHDLGHNPLTFNVANIFANYHVQILDPTDPLYEPHLNNKTGILTQVSLGHLVGDRFYSTNGGNSFLDLGPVYGSLDSVSNLLRSSQGGRLLTDPSGEYLPFDALIGAPSECGAFRVGVSAAGDLRSDENPVLTSVHTLFLREHNRLADQFAAANPSWSNEQLFQAARTELIALYQHIVFDEWLPELLGRAPTRRLGRYSSYRKDLDPTVGDTFSASAFRLLHDLVNLPLLTIDESCNLYLPDPTDGRPTQEGSNCIPLFFRAVGLEASLRGSINQFAQAQDSKFANGLRNVLLRASTRGGNLDIETANIFRGRDHQLLDFNSLRKWYTGKSLYEERRCRPGVVDSIECFNAITSNSSAAAILRDLYGKVSNIDSYVGLAVEDIQRDSFMPETATAIILEQFDRTRRADRFWYENRQMFSSRWINQIKQVKFADIIRRNTDGLVVNDEVFKVHDQCNWNSIPAPAPLHARMQR